MTGVLIKRGNLDTAVSQAERHVTTRQGSGRCFYKPIKPQVVCKPSEARGEAGADSFPQPPERVYPADTLTLSF